MRTILAIIGVTFWAQSAWAQDASTPPVNSDSTASDESESSSEEVAATESESTSEVEPYTPPPTLWWCDGLSTHDEKCIPNFEMKEIPGGVVFVGDRGGLFSTFSDQRRRRMVLPKSFWMTHTEITQGQFLGLMGFNPSTTCADVIDEQRPVSCVSWNDALVFANKLSVAMGFKPAYAVVEGIWHWDRTADGYRLPTSIEWERAAQGQSATRYAGSDNLGSVAWYRGNSARGPQRVGRRMANDFGLFDMTGNVWEWVWDGVPTSFMPTKVKPTVKDKASVRAQRGGSFADGPEWLAIPTLDNDDATYQGPTIGFRLVRNGTPIPESDLPKVEPETKDKKSPKEKKPKGKKGEEDSA